MAVAVGGLDEEAGADGGVKELEGTDHVPVAGIAGVVEGEAGAARRKADAGAGLRRPDPPRQGFPLMSAPHRSRSQIAVVCGRGERIPCARPR